MEPRRILVDKATGWTYITFIMEMTRTTAGQLSIGDKFKLKLTGRRGSVLEIDHGAPRVVIMSKNGTIEKTLHPNVVVEREY